MASQKRSDIQTGGCWNKQCKQGQTVVHDLDSRLPFVWGSERVGRIGRKTSRRLRAKSKTLNQQSSSHFGGLSISWDCSVSNQGFRRIVGKTCCYKIGLPVFLGLQTTCIFLSLLSLPRTDLQKAVHCQMQNALRTQPSADSLGGCS